MKRAFVLIILVWLFWGAAGPAVAALCQPVSHRVSTCSRIWTQAQPAFSTPQSRPDSILKGETYGWIEDYAYFYDAPSADARHVRTAMTGFFYGPVEDTASDEEGKTWYKVWGNWLPARYYHIVEASTFTGVTVNEQPQRPFGWVLRPFRPRAEAAGDADPSTAELQRYAFVQIYDSTIASDGALWYEVGDRGWVRHDYLALTTVRERPEAVGADEYWVDVDLSEQTLAAYEGDRLVFATLFSSGLSQWATRVGLNQVWERRLSAPMEGGTPGEDYYYIEAVAHTMYFDGEMSLHGAYWHDDFGRPKSHGYVNLPPRAAEWLYFWSEDAPNDLWVWSHYATHADFIQ